MKRHKNSEKREQRGKTTTGKEDKLQETQEDLSYFFFLLELWKMRRFKNIMSLLDLGLMCLIVLHPGNQSFRKTWKATHFFEAKLLGNHVKKTKTTASLHSSINVNVKCHSIVYNLLI